MKKESGNKGLGAEVGVVVNGEYKTPTDYKIDNAEYLETDERYKTYVLEKLLPNAERIMIQHGLPEALLSKYERALKLMALARPKEITFKDDGDIQKKKISVAMIPGRQYMTPRIQLDFNLLFCHRNEYKFLKPRLGRAGDFREMELKYLSVAPYEPVPANVPEDKKDLSLRKLDVREKFLTKLIESEYLPHDAIHALQAINLKERFRILQSQYPTLDWSEDKIRDLYPVLPYISYQFKVVTPEEQPFFQTQTHSPYDRAEVKRYDMYSDDQTLDLTGITESYQEFFAEQLTSELLKDFPDLALYLYNNLLMFTKQSELLMNERKHEELSSLIDTVAPQVDLFFSNFKSTGEALKFLKNSRQHPRMKFLNIIALKSDKDFSCLDFVNLIDKTRMNVGGGNPELTEGGVQRLMELVRQFNERGVTGRELDGLIDAAVSAFPDNESVKEERCRLLIEKIGRIGIVVSREDVGVLSFQGRYLFLNSIRKDPYRKFSYLYKRVLRENVVPDELSKIAKITFQENKYGEFFEEVSLLYEINYWGQDLDVTSKTSFSDSGKLGLANLDIEKLDEMDVERLGAVIRVIRFNHYVKFLNSNKIESVKKKQLVPDGVFGEKLQKLIFESLDRDVQVQTVGFPEDPVKLYLELCEKYQGYIK